MSQVNSEMYQRVRVSRVADIKLISVNASHISNLVISIRLPSSIPGAEQGKINNHFII